MDLQRPGTPQPRRLVGADQPWIAAPRSCGASTWTPAASAWPP